MSVRRTCLPCGTPGAPRVPALMLKFTPKKPVAPTGAVFLEDLFCKAPADNEDALDCAICYGPLNVDSVDHPWTGEGIFVDVACARGHVFHKGCLLNSLDRNPEDLCPECRQPILPTVAADLRRNGRPSERPAPSEAEQQQRPGDVPWSWGNNGGGGGGPFANLPPTPDRLGPSMVELSNAAERQAQERRRMEGEAMRAAQLPYQSLAPLPPMTGVNGYFFMVGGLDANPTPLQIKEAMRMQRLGVEPLYADKLHIRMSEQNLDPFYNPPHGMTVTLVQYEFNGLTDEEGDTFVRDYLDTVGVPGGLGRFYKEVFDLPTTPMAGVNGAPKWGEDPLGRPPTLQITPDIYDAWAREAREEREMQEALLLVQQQEAAARFAEQEALLLAQEQVAAARFAEQEQRIYEQAMGVRTRARAAAEARAAAAAAREEVEQLDDF